MKLYDFTHAPSPRRVRIFAAEKGLELDLVEVNLREQAQFSDAYRKINPQCVVPALELDDGTILCDATAIAGYLEEVRPEPNLMGRTPVERAQVSMWHNEVLQRGYAAAAELYRNSAPGLKTRAVIGPDDYEQIPALAERGRLRIRNFFRDLDARLGATEFVAADRFTHADITALITVDFAKRAEEHPGPEAKNFHRWWGAILDRPSYKA